MPKNTDFPGVEVDYPDLGDVPSANEMSITAGGKDYNLTAQQVMSIAINLGISAGDAATLAAALNGYITGGGGGGGGTVLDEDDFASNSATLPPSQQSTKVYVDTGLATKAASSHTHVSTAISDSTAAGRALLTATDVAAQQAILNPSDADIVASVNAEGGVALASVDDLDTDTAGALYETALLASTLAADGAFLKRNGTAIEGEALGTAARFDAIPTGAPATASSSSGTVALDFTGIAEIETTTTEAITTVNVTVEAYRWVLWTVIQTTARNITFPAGTVISGTAGSLTHTGVANSTTRILIYKRDTTLNVIVGDSAVVGS